jgi:LacI family transcriptional regulator
MERLPTELARKVTIKDVARLAGVSPMTASRALAGNDRVHADKLQLVVEAAKALGYHRNENARSLRPGHASGMIGVAITNLGNPYYGAFAMGVEEVATEFGRRVILGNTGEDGLREEQLIADFAGRQVEGLVLVPSSGPRSSYALETLTSRPLVLASRLLDGVDVDAVLVDDIGGAERGVDALIRAGHQRIAYLGNNVSTFTDDRRFQGFEHAMARAGLSVNPELVRRDQHDVGAARAAMETLLDRSDPPGAVFCANNRNAIGALMAIGTRLKPGRPVAELPAVASFDSFELAELMPVPVTIVDHDPHALGREAGRLLFERLNGEYGGGARTVVIPAIIRDAKH